MDLYQQAASLSVEAVVELLRWKNQAEPRIENLERQLAWFRRQLFGASSERRLLQALSPADQLLLDQEMLKPSEEAPEPTTTVKSYERQQRQKPTDFVDSDSRLKFDDTVPVEEVLVPNPETEGLSEEDYQVVDERVTYRLAQREGPYVVLKYVQPVVKLKTGLSCPPIPPAIFARSFADVSLLAGMVVDKFLYHLPLYRQHQRLKQAGVSLHRSTLTRLIHRTGELVEPIYTAVLSSVLAGEVLIVDESPTPAGRGDKKMKKGYYWALYGDQAEVAFLFSPTRARSVLDEALSVFGGTLVSDGYRAYDSFAQQTANVVHAQCWAHARRKFIDAEALAPKQCAQILALLQDLYEIEQRARGKPNKLAKLREQESRAIVEEIFKRLESEMSSAAWAPSHPFIQAADYTLTRKHQLGVFLDNPEVPLDTNSVERTLRGPAVGRKNWMFHVTEVGARYGAMFYTLLQSCALCDVHPTQYLTDILQRVAVHPAADTHLLIPRLWKEHFSSEPMRSDLSR